MVEGELNPWLEEVLDQTTIPEQVSLVRELSPGLPMVKFDRDKMRRVVINLITNAIQAVMAQYEIRNEEGDSYHPQVKVYTSKIVSSGYFGDPVMIDSEKYGFYGAVLKLFRVHELSKIFHGVKN